MNLSENRVFEIFATLNTEDDGFIDELGEEEFEKVIFFLFSLMT